jgi:hypothetical protein
MRTSPLTLLFRALVALVAVVVLAAGCSSDTEPTDAGSGSDDSSDSETSTDGDASGDDSGSDGDTSAEESTGSDSDTDKEDPEPMGDLSASVAIYCEAKAADDAASDAVDPTDPDSVRAWVYQSRDALRDVIPQAPEELRADLAILLDGFEQFIVILEAHEFDFFAALPEIEALADSSDQELVGDRLDAWEAANCPTASIDLDEAASGSSLFDAALADPAAIEAMLGSEGGRELFINEMTADGELTREQAECVLDHPDFTSFFTLLGGGEDAAADVLPAIIGVFSECGIDLATLAG